MASTSLKVGWVVLFVLGLFMVYMGVMMVFSTQDMYVPNFEAFTAEAWTDLATDYPKVAEMVIMDTRLMGAMLLGSAIFVLFIVWSSYRKGHKWSWYALLFGNALGWGSALVYHIVIGYAMATVMMIIGVILFLIGIVVPAKAILCPKAGK